MKTNWQQVALVLLGLIVGGGAAGAVGQLQYSRLQAEVRAEDDAQEKMLTAILVQVGRLDSRVDSLTVEVSRLRDRLNE